MPAERPPVSPSTPPPNPGGCLLRVLWMLVGNAFLLITALKIAQPRAEFFSVADIVFWGVVVGVAVVRYVDIHRFDGHTAKGRRATPADYRRYLLLLGTLSLALWLIAHALGHAAR